MHYSRSIFICLCLIHFGCGYTILRRPITSDRRVSQPDTTIPVVPSPIQMSDSLLFGEWAGPGRCFNHGGRTDSTYWITFGSDYSWTLRTDKSTIRGTWRSSGGQNEYLVHVKTWDSPWIWNGLCRVRVRDNELILTIDRPWQFNCRLTLVRIASGSQDDQ